MPLYIRSYWLQDRPSLTKLILNLRESYPSIDSWLEKQLDKFGNPLWDCSVIVDDDTVVGVAISELIPRPYKNNVVKLKTFCVDEKYEGFALGPYLLDRVIEHWALQNVSKIFVTFTDTQHDRLAPFFEKHGFVYSGLSPNLYTEGSSEYIMDKLFVYSEITEREFEKIVLHYLFHLRGYSVTKVNGNSYLVKNKMAPWSPKLVKVYTHYPPDSNNVLYEMRQLLKQYDDMKGLVISYYHFDVNHTQNIRIIDGQDIETLLYPLQLRRKGDAAVILPIKPNYSLLLLYDSQQTVFRPSKSALRRDKAFFRYPQGTRRIKRGQAFLFYETAPTSGIIGEAKIDKVDITTPEKAFETYEAKGVLTLDEIQSYVDKRTGKVMVLLLGKTTKYKHKISFNDIKESIIPSFNPQGVTLLTQDQLDRIRSLGGFEWHK